MRSAKYQILKPNIFLVNLQNNNHSVAALTHEFSEETENKIIVKARIFLR